ncbi:MAG: hypothetical protein J0L72_03805 [Armatimonadetes bacterium]|nr:hypothetical protein [Armatimonadota bacterium]
MNKTLALAGMLAITVCANAQAPTFRLTKTIVMPTSISGSDPLLGQLVNSVVVLPSGEMFITGAPTGTGVTSVNLLKLTNWLTPNGVMTVARTDTQTNGRSTEIMYNGTYLFWATSIGQGATSSTDFGTNQMEVFKVNPADGTLVPTTTVTNPFFDGILSAAEMSSLVSSGTGIQDITIDPQNNGAGEALATDRNGSRAVQRYLSGSGGSTTTILPGASPILTSPNTPRSLSFDSTGNGVFMRHENDLIRFNRTAFGQLDNGVRIADLTNVPNVQFQNSLIVPAGTGYDEFFMMNDFSLNGAANLVTPTDPINSNGLVIMGNAATGDRTGYPTIGSATFGSLTPTFSIPFSTRAVNFSYASVGGTPYVFVCANTSGFKAVYVYQLNADGQVDLTKTLTSWVGSDRTISVEVRDPANANAVVDVLNIGGANGTASSSTMYSTFRGTADLYCKPEGYLGKKVAGVSLGSSAASATFSFICGDVDGDDEVGANDFDTVVLNFGVSPATIAQGDVDGDGEVGSTDFDIVVANYGLTGD